MTEEELASKTRLLRSLMGELSETAGDQTVRRAELHARIAELQAESVAPMSVAEMRKRAWLPT